VAQGGDEAANAAFNPLDDDGLGRRLRPGVDLDFVAALAQAGQGGVANVGGGKDSNCFTGHGRFAPPVSAYLEGGAAKEQALMVAGPPLSPPVPVASHCPYVALRQSGITISCSFSAASAHFLLDTKSRCVTMPSTPERRWSNTMISFRPGEVAAA